MTPVQVLGTCKASASRKERMPAENDCWVATRATQQESSFVQPVSEDAPKQAGSFLDYIARSNMTYTCSLASSLQFLSTCL